MKKIIITLAMLLLSAIALSAQQKELREYTKVGQQMPAFKINDLSGTPFDMEAQKGKVVVVYFWATWCPYCRKEMPYIDAWIWKRYKSPDFAMIGIAREEEDPDITRYLKANPLTFPMAADPTGEVFEKFANGGIPRCYLVGRDGKILSQEAGYYPERFEAWGELIDKELKKIEKDKKKSKSG